MSKFIREDDDNIKMDDDEYEKSDSELELDTDTSSVSLSQVGDDSTDDDMSIPESESSSVNLEDNEEEPEKKSMSAASQMIPGKKEFSSEPVLYSENIDLDEEEEDDDVFENLQKFDEDLREDYVDIYHPECKMHNYHEITNLARVIRNAEGIIIDDFHRTIPFLTKYEKTRILGMRAKQINAGATPFVKVPENIIDGYLIAQMELEEKVIPFIIRRPLPNGIFEYWRISDLEII